MQLDSGGSDARLTILEPDVDRFARRIDARAFLTGAFKRTGNLPASFFATRP